MFISKKQLNELIMDVKRLENMREYSSNHIIAVESDAVRRHNETMETTGNIHTGEFLDIQEVSK